MSREKLVIYEGAFDPPLPRHAALARAALGQLGADRVILLPSAPGREGADAEKIYERCAEAVKGEPGVEVSDLELRSPDGCAWLSARHFSAFCGELYFLTDAAGFLKIEELKYPQLLMQLVIFAVGIEDDGEREAVLRQKDLLEGRGYCVRTVEYGSRGPAEDTAGSAPENAGAQISAPARRRKTCPPDACAL